MMDARCCPLLCCRLWAIPPLMTDLFDGYKDFTHSEWEILNFVSDLWADSLHFMPFMHHHPSSPSPMTRGTLCRYKQMGPLCLKSLNIYPISNERASIHHHHRRPEGPRMTREEAPNATGPGAPRVIPHVHISE